MVQTRTGTDIVAVARIEDLVRARGDAFLRKWFTPREIAYCLGKFRPGPHLAARFAGKEAILKALPVAWTGPIPWRSIEIVNDPDGRPVVTVGGLVGVAARQARAYEFQVSLSHCDDYATAVALVQVAGEGTQ